MDIIANIFWHEARAIDFTNLDMKAILSGEKTQIRKTVIVPRILRSLGCNLETSSINRDEPLEECIRFHGSSAATYKVDRSTQWLHINYYCPFGRSGNYLWIREPYQQLPNEEVIYQADLGHEETEENAFSKAWTSAGEMPISLSRGAIEITKIRLQRLGVMTEEEAKAEGMHTSFYNPTYLEAFRRHWNKTTKQSDWYKFENCPLVWVIEFAPSFSLEGKLLNVDVCSNADFDQQMLV